jgi:hypothetical protein
VSRFSEADVHLLCTLLADQVGTFEKYFSPPPHEAFWESENTLFTVFMGINEYANTSDEGFISSLLRLLRLLTQRCLVSYFAHFTASTGPGTGRTSLSPTSTGPKPVRLLPYSELLSPVSLSLPSLPFLFV